MFRGHDYGALKARSDQNYDEEAGNINDMSNGPNPWKSLDLINNGQNRTSQWAPWLQALQEAGGNKNGDVTLGQDAERPHGLASNPAWWGQSGQGQAMGLGSGGNSPYEQSTNIGTRTHGNVAIRGLMRAHQQKGIGSTGTNNPTADEGRM